MKEYAIYLFDFDGTLFDTKLSLRKAWKDCSLMQVKNCMSHTVQHRIL